MADEPQSWPIQREPQVGDYIGHYRLEQLLAVGGMGVVYRAFEATLNRHVAIKLLSPKLAADQEFVSRFLQEAQAVAKLNHQNIIHIYYIGQHGDLLYFAMELVDGYDLETLLRQHRQFHVREAVGFIYQAAIALQYAHKNNLLHRDIKPSNLMVTGEGLVKVTDFGLARNIKADQSTGMPLSILGTPDYLSPEEIRGQHIDHRSDMYSLGATLYHLLAGRPPFVGRTQEEILRHHLHSNPTPIRQLNLNVPPMLQQILERLLAKQPGGRYLTYDPLIQDLERFLKDRPIALNQSSPAIAKPTTPAGTTPAGATPAAATPAPKQKSNVRAVFMAVITITFLAGGGWFAYQWMTAPSNTPKVSQETEDRAYKIYKNLKRRSDAQLNAGFYGEAWTVFNEWPADFAPTQARQDVEVARARVRDAAKLAWNKAQAKAQKLREEEEFGAARDVYAVVQQSCHDIPELITEINKQVQATEQEERDSQKRLGKTAPRTPTPQPQPPKN